MRKVLNLSSHGFGGVRKSNFEICNSINLITATQWPMRLEAQKRGAVQEGISRAKVVNGLNMGQGDGHRNGNRASRSAENKAKGKTQE